MIFTTVLPVFQPLTENQITTIMIFIAMILALSCFMSCIYLSVNLSCISVYVFMQSIMSKSKIPFEVNIGTVVAQNV